MVKQKKNRLNKNKNYNILTFDEMDIEDLVDLSYSDFTEKDKTLGNCTYNDSSVWCIKGKIATSYTFNQEDPSMPYCKCNQTCKFKVKNYTERPNCLFMHMKYESEIK